MNQIELSADPLFRSTPDIIPVVPVSLRLAFPESVAQRFVRPIKCPAGIEK